MKIVVLVKQVPDTWGERELDLATGRLDRAASDAIIDEIGERSAEVALRAKDTDKSTEVIAITMGPRSATDVLRKVLAMGADRAVHVLDDRLEGADMALTARVLSEAIGRIDPDVIVAGNESTDGRGGVIAAMVAELLSIPLLDSLDSLEIASGMVSGVRVTESSQSQVHASTPVVLSITERAAEPRFPSFKGILSAKKKPIETLSLAELSIDPTGSRSTVLATDARPARVAGQKIVDDGTAAAQLVGYLAAAHLI